MARRKRYEGKDDPKLALVRFDIGNAKIWLSDVEGFLKPVLNKRSAGNRKRA